MAINEDIPSAVRYFWSVRSSQAQRSSESTNRGAVTAGKQMDGFISLLRQTCLSAGVPAECIFDRNNHVPGFFRASKNWDLMVVSPTGKLIALAELKSQIGSYGNNFNNRSEEAIGSATDFWTAYREKVFPPGVTPWVGFMMLIGRDDLSMSQVRNYSEHFPVMHVFDNTSYLDRYRILCERLVTERLYSACCLMWTDGPESFGNVLPHLSLERLLMSLTGHIIGCMDEFSK